MGRRGRRLLRPASRVMGANNAALPDDGVHEGEDYLEEGVLIDYQDDVVPEAIKIYSPTIERHSDTADAAGPDDDDDEDRRSGRRSPRSTLLDDYVLEDEDEEEDDEEEYGAGPAWLQGPHRGAAEVRRGADRGKWLKKRVDSRNTLVGRCALIIESLY